MEHFPKRKTDGAYVVEEIKHSLKMGLVPGPLRLVKRFGGVEKQHRMLCKGCGIFVGYRNADMENESKYSYFLSDAFVNSPNEFKKIIAGRRHARLAQENLNKREIDESGRPILMKTEN